MHRYSRWIKFPVLVILASVVFAGCATRNVIVDTNDDTPPSIKARLLPDNLMPRYLSGLPVSGFINPDLAFWITPPQDISPMGLNAEGSDEQSGVRQMNGQFDLNYTCTVISGSARGETGRRSTNFNENFSNLAEAGDSVTGSSGLAMSFTLQDLWERSCLRWGALTVRSGRISNIEGSYTFSVNNNAIPSLNSAISGNFEVRPPSTDQNGFLVDLDR